MLLTGCGLYLLDPPKKKPLAAWLLALQVFFAEICIIFRIPPSETAACNHSIHSLGDDPSLSISLTLAMFATKVAPLHTDV